MGVGLVLVVLIYDLGGEMVREHLGPPLLACARGISLMLAPVSVLGLEECAAVVGPLPVLAYMLYFLFLSRLAQREERGVPGMKALSYLLMGAVAPSLVLFDPEVQGNPQAISLAASMCLLLASLLVAPAWKRPLRVLGTRPGAGHDPPFPRRRAAGPQRRDVPPIRPPRACSGRSAAR